MVKKQWASNCSAFIEKIENHDKAVKAGRTIFGTISSAIPVLKDIKDAILAINPIDYITIKPVIEDDCGKKEVVLVFDDLERIKADISVNDIFGAINDYCENQHFRVIIVANEEKIDKGIKAVQSQSSDQPNNISYIEIKEKIIARTLQIAPDYNSIVNSLIDERTWGNDDEYTEYVQDNKELIQLLFASVSDIDDDSERNENRKPHNIRSLKCALQDFHRIYKLFLQVEGKDNFKNFSQGGKASLKLMFMQMIAYVMESKAGREIYNDLFQIPDEVLSTLEIEEYEENFSYMQRYPDEVFQKSTASKAFVRWITQGVYNDKQIKDDILSLIEMNSPNQVKSLELFLYSDPLSLEWDAFENGYKEALEAAYSGAITSEQYIGLLLKIYRIKEHNILLPVEPDYDKMSIAYDSVNILIEEEPVFGYGSIGMVEDKAKDLFNKIKQKIDTRATEKRRKEYYDYCLKYFRNDENALEKHIMSSTTIQISLDEDLIDAIVNSFKHSSNKLRRTIGGSFNSISFADYRISSTAPLLIRKLQLLMESPDIDQISKANYYEFISVIRGKFGLGESETN